jgi:hypothetical protein
MSSPPPPCSGIAQIRFHRQLQDLSRLNRDISLERFSYVKGETRQMQFIGSAVLVFLVGAVSISSIAIAEIPQNRAFTEQNGVGVQNDHNSASVTFSRPAGGVTQIGIKRVDLYSNAYVTMVTASGPTREDAAMVVAILQTFTNLNTQGTFADTKSITLAINQANPPYVISELERSKLISPVEALVARTAFDRLRSRMDSKPAPAESSR